MRNVNLKKYNIRTDIVDEQISNMESNIKVIKDKNITINRLYIDKNQGKTIKRKSGNYTTIYFKDISDSDNYNNVLKNLIKELKEILNINKIDNKSSVLVVGLGNIDSTPDSLGVLTANKVLVTKHIKDLTGKLEKGYRISTSFSPNVMGKTGIESSKILNKIVNVVKPDFIIIIDSLASSNLDNLSKCIQITDTGINPGSGIGNNRKKINGKIGRSKVITLGVPLVVSLNTVIFNTLNELNIKINKQNLNNKDLIVTPTDIDFLVDKLSNLISEAINNIICNKY